MEKGVQSPGWIDRVTHTLRWRFHPARRQDRMMKTFLPLSSAVCVAIFLAAPTLLAAPKNKTEGVPQPQRYAALLAKARAGTLRVNHGEPPERPRFFLFRARPEGAGDEIFPPTSYRAAAKTSFAAGAVQNFTSINSLFNPLPKDAAMTQQFPALVRKSGNTSPRVALEKRNMKAPAWIYWVAKESDRDFHVILGSTAQLTSTTIFLNSEVSGLPQANPTKSPFPQRRAGIRAILANHRNVNGLFVTPVPVTVSGSLFWDGEHRFPNTVGPEGLQPTKAWEIHPIKQLAER